LGGADGGKPGTDGETVVLCKEDFSTLHAGMASLKPSSVIGLVWTGGGPGDSEGDAAVWKVGM